MWVLILIHCVVTFSLRLLAKFEFPARISNKTCLNLYSYSFFLSVIGVTVVHETTDRKIKEKKEER